MDARLDEYVIQERIAPALFGDVLLCRHQPTGDRVAVKRILQRAAAERTTLASRKRVRENVALERELLRRVRARGGHRGLVALRDEIEADGFLYLVSDYCAHGELFELVKERGKLSAATTRAYASQIAQGVRFLHESGFAHRDLSLENVLLTADDECKVCDFGLAAPADEVCSETVGKMFYMAPEVLSGAAYDPTKADVWSLGVMVFIMLTGAPPVESASMADARFQIISVSGVRELMRRWKLTESVPSSAIDFVEGMLEVDAGRRLTMEQVVNHPFLTNELVVETIKEIPAFVHDPRQKESRVAKACRVSATLHLIISRGSKKLIQLLRATQPRVAAVAA